MALQSPRPSWCCSPLSPPTGEQWDEAALDAFERLTCCAQWKPLVAKISSYTQAGLCTWPRITLFDVRHGEVSPEPHCSPPFTPRGFGVLHLPLISPQSLDIGAELVRLGHAALQPHEEEEAGGGFPLPATEAAVETPVSRAAVERGTAGLWWQLFSPQILAWVIPRVGSFTFLPHVVELTWLFLSAPYAGRHGVHLP